MVSRTYQYVSRPAYEATGVAKDNYSSGTQTGAFKKQEMANICLESLWALRLRCIGWSRRAAKQATLSIAESTLKTYNNCVKRYISFCNEGQQDFANEHNTALLSDFLYQAADSSDRPEAILKSC